jgi:hypothetical protein
MSDQPRYFVCVVAGSWGTLAQGRKGSGGFTDSFADDEDDAEEGVARARRLGAFGDEGGLNDVLSAWQVNSTTGNPKKKVSCGTPLKQCRELHSNECLRHGKI